VTNVVTLSNISALQSYSGGASPAICIEGYATAGDGGEGMFTYVPSDTTSPDNGATIIVDTSGHRYYREQHLGPFNILWFGGSPNGVTDNSAALNYALGQLRSTGWGNVLSAGEVSF
jgi:hypothetical protein